jgi:hypothetical protein
MSTKAISPNALCKTGKDMSVTPLKDENPGKFTLPTPRFPYTRKGRTGSVLDVVTFERRKPKA